MRLSKNFTLEEFLVSQTAVRHCIDMTPPPEVVENIHRLVDSCLQPLRDHVAMAINISSGFRPVELNTRIGGSDTSEHVYGNAVDFTVSGFAPLKVAQIIVEIKLPFDQIIHEFGAWVHWGLRDSLRGEILTAYKDEQQKTRYKIGLHRISDLS